MNWMIQYSKTRLTNRRRGEGTSINNFTTSLIYNDQIKNDEKKKYQQPTVDKAITTSLHDIKYTENEVLIQISGEGEPLMYEATSLKDPYSYTIVNEILLGISGRIELATICNVTNRYASSPYQTTNYGLSGLVDTHMDPYGYEMGVNLKESRAHLVLRGDYIATFMGWFKDVPAGGGTAFHETSFEDTLEAKKGSAAFWINLSSCHVKDKRSSHGGCPVLKGTKWIVNKWIYSWDQWKYFSCRLLRYLTIGAFEGLST